MTHPPAPPKREDSWNLARFLEAQAKIYETVVSEIKRGAKRTHWMWFIFPQMKGLGQSPTSIFYGLTGCEEAHAYLEHPLLGGRLVECSTLLLSHEGRKAPEILGAIDAMKLRSSMTLFVRTASSQPVFSRVLAAFFQGEEDPQTLALLEGPPEAAPPPS